MVTLKSIPIYCGLHSFISLFNSDSVIGDNWGVTLKGDMEDYIHAVFVNVRMHTHLIHYVSLPGYYSGLQAAESIYRSSESHGVHSQRFLEDDLRQEVWSDCHAL